jgi:hypothetical protein
MKRTVTLTCELCGYTVFEALEGEKYCRHCKEGHMGFVPQKVELHPLAPKNPKAMKPSVWIKQVYQQSYSGDIITTASSSKPMKLRPGAKDGDEEFTKEPKPVEEPLKEHRRLELP